MVSSRRMEKTLTLLKLRMLLQALDQVPDSGQHPLVIREAELASVLAARTAFPELVFPLLFEERVASALAGEERRRKRYWGLMMAGSLGHDHPQLAIAPASSGG
jgi:hypothetical protein